MPWTKDKPPSVAKNWTADEQARCIKSANKVIAVNPQNEKGAIFACIAAAGKGKIKFSVPDVETLDDTPRVRLANFTGGQSEESSDRFIIPFAKGDDGWILIFPIGKFKREGRDREFTAEMGREMVRNYHDNVLERLPPVNAEHMRDKGRLARVVDLELREDAEPAGVYGRLQEVEGYEGGLRKFDHLSPEVRWKWTHPFTGKQHKNVLFGAAATNYPFFLGRMALHGEPLPFAKALLWEDDEWVEFAPEQSSDVPFTHEAPIVRADEAERVVYGIVFVPGEFDAQGHRLSADTIESACHDFAERLQLDEKG